jgi:hypothetical protein
MKSLIIALIAAIAGAILTVFLKPFESDVRNLIGRSPIAATYTFGPWAPNPSTVISQTDSVADVLKKIAAGDMNQPGQMAVVQIQNRTGQNINDIIFIPGSRYFPAVRYYVLPLDRRMTQGENDNVTPDRIEVGTLPPAASRELFFWSAHFSEYHFEESFVVANGEKYSISRKRDPLDDTVIFAIAIGVIIVLVLFFALLSVLNNAMKAYKKILSDRDFAEREHARLIAEGEKFTFPDRVT